MSELAGSGKKVVNENRSTVFLCVIRRLKKEQVTCNNTFLAIEMFKAKPSL